MSFVLAKRILKAHPHGFVGAIVEGKRGVGKSSYCIKVMKDAYQTFYGLDDVEAYEYALDHLLFDLNEVIPFLKKAAYSDEMVLVVTWDDAGVHGSSFRWFTNMRQVEILKAMTDTIRTGVTGFILNCPNRMGLLKVLREYDDYIIDIVKENGSRANGSMGYERMARGYNLFRLPSGTRRVYKSFEDHYSCYLPEWVYEKYMKKRNTYFQKAVDEMERLQKKYRRKIEILDEINV